MILMYTCNLQMLIITLIKRSVGVFVQFSGMFGYTKSIRTIGKPKEWIANA
jgi:hypothetical protein